MNVDIRTADDFTLIFKQKLGQGSFGEVWTADYHYKGKTYNDIAVKMLKLKDGDLLFSSQDLLVSHYDVNKKLFTSEVNIIKSLNNPKYTITIYDAFIVENKTDSVAFIIIEKLDSTYLTKITTDAQKYKGEQWFSIVKNISMQLLEDIQFIHKKGIIHSDIKPENILYNPKTKRFVLSDFGISCVQKCTDFAGTAEYVDPQLFTRMKKNNDKESDLYSIGCVIYDLFIKGSYNRLTMTHKLVGLKLFNTEAYTIVFEESIKSLSTFLTTKKITATQAKGFYRILYSMLDPFKNKLSATTYLKQIAVL